MKNVKIKSDNLIFNLILVLLFFSFFEESLLPQMSVITLVAIFAIPFVILFYFVCAEISFNKGDRNIIKVFALFMIVQILGIRFSSVYHSLTQIYRSFSSLLCALYIRNLKITQKKISSVAVFSAVLVVVGFISFLLKEVSNGNLFFGNLNTVGALYFVLCVVDLAIYLKYKRAAFVVLSLLNLIIILISNTRTAFLLLLITAVLFFCIKLSGKKKINSKLFFSVMILLLIAFVIFYYNITEKAYHDAFNKISNDLFNKNFDSGRPKLWHYTVDAVGSKWLIGQGTGAGLKEFVDGVENSHNSFLEIYLQNGVIGMGLFVLCILVCLKEKGNCSKNSLNVFIMVIAFIVISYNTLGVVLVKPRSGIGLIQWVLISLPYVANPDTEKTKETASDKFSSSGIQRKEVY